VNATAAREEADNVELLKDVGKSSIEAHGYADAQAGGVEARLNGRVEELRDALGDYRETTQIKLDSERDLIYHWIAGTFTLLCFLISLSGVYSHTRKFRYPEIQRKILAILWMPPIYSLCCWLSLLYPAAAAGLAMVRDGYEAYTIWVFVSFLVSIVGGDEALAGDASPGGRALLRRDPYSRFVARLEADGSAHLPYAFCPPCGRKASPRSFLRQCMVAVMQFVLCKPLLSVAAYVVVCADAQYYSDRDRPQWVSDAKLVIFVLANLSVTVAVSGLLKVYHATAHYLESHAPWPKFCCVKGVVFITFWQGSVIWALTRENALQSELAEAVQNFLICVEMFVASVVHSYVFSPDEWQPNFKPPSVVRMTDNLAMRDFIQDMRYVLAPQQPTVKKERKRAEVEAELKEADENDFEDDDDDDAGVSVANSAAAADDAVANGAEEADDDFEDADDDAAVADGPDDTDAGDDVEAGAADGADGGAAEADATDTAGVATEGTPMETPMKTPLRDRAPSFNFSDDDDPEAPRPDDPEALRPRDDDGASPPMFESPAPHEARVILADATAAGAETTAAPYRTP